MNENNSLLEQNYLDLKSKAKKVIEDLFAQHSNFHSLSEELISDLRSKYADSPYRFRFVVQKYFMNVTFDYRAIPYRYILPVFDFYLTQKFYPSYNKVISTYKDDFIQRSRNIRQIFPDLIETEEDVSQIIKLIMACTLTTYISHPIFTVKKERLKHSYLAGFYLGIAYLISDKILDNKNITITEKFYLHNEILKFLSNPQNAVVEHPLIKPFACQVISEFEPKSSITQYELLYHLQRIQFEDALFIFNEKSIDSIKEKTVNSGLKTFLSLQAVQSCGRDFDMFKNFQTNFLYSLLVQLDDDLRDIKKDREQGIRTFFSDSIESEHFSPHKLYLALVAIFVGKNKQLTWMYTDYFAHLKNPNNQGSLDHDKIILFLEKTTSCNLKDLTHQILH